MNRYEHFKACFESLERCTGAEFTDVYIGLDYPPSDKYVEGWKKIDSFLECKEKNHIFKKLVVFRRNQNCGVGTPNSNAGLLHQYVIARYDRYISSEDDNIFSPNFLEYINKGLEKYENDFNCHGIVGYCHPYSFKNAGNNHFRHITDMSSWGYAMFVRENENMHSFVENEGFRKAFNIKNILKVKKFGWNNLFLFFYCAFHKNAIRVTDGIESIYMIINNKYVIIPTLSKVRNIGWDESGQSFKNGLDANLKSIASRHNNQVIDDNLLFDYIGDDQSYVEHNNRIAVEESDGKISFLQFVKLITKSIYNIIKKRLILIIK